MPKIVFVKLYAKDGKDLDWTLPGLSEPGLYPIVSTKKDWFLDKGRLHPILKIKRQQLPLTPAFAMTAHAAQGQTFSKGAIVDMNVGGSSSAMSSYVALTRVEILSKLLIFRAVSLCFFDQGQQPGPDLLFCVWRGDTIDWKAIELLYMPQKRCPGCGMLKYRHAYAKSEWAKESQTWIVSCV